jgi:hypothetical protein
MVDFYPGRGNRRWSYNIKTVTDEFLRALLCVRGITDRRT